MILNKVFIIFFYLNISLLFIIVQKLKMENELILLNQFITNNNYNINKLYVDRFWGNIDKNIWIYIDENLINWIGYNNINGKQKYIDIIKKNFEENIDYKIYNYNEINEIFHSPQGVNEINKEILQFKDKITNNLHNRTQHIILSPRCCVL